jgi:hypothetical protein
MRIFLVWRASQETKRTYEKRSSNTKNHQKDVHEIA